MRGVGEGVGRKGREVREAEAERGSCWFEQGQRAHARVSEVCFLQQPNARGTLAKRTPFSPRRPARPSLALDSPPALVQRILQYHSLS